ncbi:MAG: enoyl-CoA hydratase/isomerase family protein, partial [Ktedonobacterales bacterium]|nr:enoyl-CoA hydratase/isomerase family protein [Ktedonobacterales bacterium]
METPTYPFVQVSVTGSVATITLDRPEVHNAFDATLIASLTAAFHAMGTRDDLRAVVLRGAGASFCAGADLAWMRASLA